MVRASAVAWHGTEIFLASWGKRMRPTERISRRAAVPQSARTLQLRALGRSPTIGVFAKPGRSWHRSRPPLLQDRIEL
jgi:hypothetical protein